MYNYTHTHTYMYITLFFLLSQVSLCNLTWPRICFLAQAVLEFHAPASAPEYWDSQTCAVCAFVYVNNFIQVASFMWSLGRHQEWGVRGDWSGQVGLLLVDSGEGQKPVCLQDHLEPHGSSACPTPSSPVTPHPCYEDTEARLCNVLLT